MLCLAAENAAWKWMAKVCRAPCSRPGCLQIMLGSALVCSCCFRRRFANFKPFVFEEGLARKLCFHIFNYHLLREASHENFFHIFYFHVFRESRTKSSVFTTSTFSFGGWPCMIVFLHLQSGVFRFRAKASFAQLGLSVLEGSLARKLRVHIFSFQFWRELSHESFSQVEVAVQLWQVCGNEFSLIVLGFCLRVESRTCR